MSITLTPSEMKFIQTESLMDLADQLGVGKSGSKFTVCKRIVKKSGEHSLKTLMEEGKRMRAEKSAGKKKMKPDDDSIGVTGVPGMLMTLPQLLTPKQLKDLNFQHVKSEGNQHFYLNLNLAPQPDPAISACVAKHIGKSPTKSPTKPPTKPPTKSPTKSPSSASPKKTITKGSTSTKPPTKAIAKKASPEKPRKIWNDGELDDAVEGCPNDTRRDQDVMKFIMTKLLRKCFDPAFKSRGVAKQVMRDLYTLLDPTMSESSINGMSLKELITECSLALMYKIEGDPGFDDDEEQEECEGEGEDEEEVEEEEEDDDEEDDDDDE